MNLESLVYSRPFGRLALYPVALAGYRRFERTGTTPGVAYSAMRKLFGNRDAALFERLAARAGRDAAPVSDTPSWGIAVAEVETVVDRLRRDGFAVLSNQLDESSCAALEEVARRAQCSVVGVGGREPTRRQFDPVAPGGIRFDLDEEDIVASDVAQRLIVDPSLLAVARRYLGVEPVQDLVAMWWSAASETSDLAADAAAQQFHFDLDRLRFLKVFVYLTDVDEDTGPHVYVRGSHRPMPQRFRRDGRHSDGAVADAFAGDVTEIAGRRGTVFLADTRGLHKGRDLRTGHRLVFQTEYASSMFGAPYQRVVVRSPSQEFARAVVANHRTFQRFTIAPA